MSTTREAYPYAPQFLAHLQVYSLRRLRKQLHERLQQVNEEIRRRNGKAGKSPREGTRIRRGMRERPYDWRAP